MRRERYLIIVPHVCLVTHELTSELVDIIFFEFVEKLDSAVLVRVVVHRYGAAMECKMTTDGQSDAPSCTGDKRDLATQRPLDVLAGA